MVDLNYRWQEFVTQYKAKTNSNDVWGHAIQKLNLTKVEGGVAYFECENAGVKTLALNKQVELKSILSAVLETRVNGIFCEVVTTSKKPPTQQGASSHSGDLFAYKPTIVDSVRAAGLNPKSSFENYAVSSSNNVAYAAAQVVAGQYGKVYNPLFLWGGVGVGKTHLAQATARRILESSPETRVYFCPGDKFTNEIIDAIRTRSTDKFRAKYRRLDVLVVDDVQFIAGKETVQQEFFHTFNDIVARGGQIILISDRPPHQINDIQDRLKSRFTGGLTIDINPPDFELKTAIVMLKGRDRGMEIDIEAAKVIAEVAEDNRMLEGILVSAYAKSFTQNPPGQQNTISKQDVLLAISGSTRPAPSATPDPQDIIRAVCDYYKLKPSHLKAQDRASSLVRARQIAMYIMREKLSMNLESIAHILKRKDHTTVIHGVTKVREHLIHNPQIANDVGVIIKNIFGPQGV